MLLDDIKPSLTSQNNSVYILNLSTLPELAPIDSVLDNFSKLHYDYANSWLHYAWYSKLWISYHYFTMNGAMNDYKLGKINTDRFISQLQEIFYFLPPENSAELIKNTWNSLIVWNAQASQRLNYVLEKNQVVNLISNTNELNIQKIKQHFERATQKKWGWQKQTSGEYHFQVFENVRLMTSYENGVYKTEGLLERLVTQLVSEGHQRELITLVSQYQADLDKAKTLGIIGKKHNQFFTELATSAASTDFQALSMAVTNHLENCSGQGQGQGQAKFFCTPKMDSTHEQPQNDSEKSPLLMKP